MYDVLMLTLLEGFFLLWGSKCVCIIMQHLAGKNHESEAASLGCCVCIRRAKLEIFSKV